MRAALQGTNWENPFEQGAPEWLPEVLTSYVVTRRWYRDKTRSVHTLVIKDIFPIPETASYIVMASIGYAEGDTQVYLFDISVAQGALAKQIAAEQPGSVIARLQNEDGTAGIFYDAFANPKFATALLAAIGEQKVFRGRTGDLMALRTRAFPSVVTNPGPDLYPPDLEPRVSKAEQSNTSIIFGDRAILKVFRKLEEGINPDIEIGMFLTERDFKYTPAVAGSIEYKPDDSGPIYIAILQRFVKNQGDAWQYTLDSLSGFYRTVLAEKGLPPVLTTYHPLQLALEGIPPEAQRLIGGYLESAALLGDRTAQMHAALTDSNAGDDFAPEPVTARHRRETYDNLVRQVDSILQLLRREHSKLSEGPAEDVSKVLAAEDKIRQRFQTLFHQDISALRIRHHGDFHLGQVLYTGDDFLIIDYEGEPVRTLAERREKNLAMRDVAGMVRSFQYASYAALPESGLTASLQSYAAFWTACVSATYLMSYFSVANGLPFVSATQEERRLLLDVFLLQKALYEVTYELNNRPAWVSIPLRGILGLVT
jgi:maltose alpha-D-glucosyltransferase/alpha-amylase